MNIQDIVRDAHSNAKAKGWHDQERSFGELIALCHSELSEALEVYRAGWGLNEIMEHRVSRKPEGIPIELADVIIRVADMCGLYEYELNLAREFGCRCDYETKTFGEFINMCHYMLSQTYNKFYAESYVVYWLSVTVKAIQIYSEIHDIDLDEAIKIKMEYNLTRDIRHGGKVL